MITERDFVRRIIAIIWHSKLLFLSLLILLSAAFIFVIMHIAPIYRATALVDVSPEASLPMANRDRRESASDPILIQTEVDILSSDQIARLVIQKLDLAKSPGF